LLGALCQTSYIFVYINPIPWLYYTFSGVAGLGGTFIWVGLGCEIAINSNDKTAHRNTCAYWGGFMAGSLAGNLYVFFAWAGHSVVTEELQRNTAIITGTISLIGSFVFLLLRPLPQDEIVKESGLSKGAMARVAGRISRVQIKCIFT